MRSGKTNSVESDKHGNVPHYDSATIKNEKELDAWVDEAKAAIKAKLKNGSVII